MLLAAAVQEAAQLPKNGGVKDFTCSVDSYGCQN